MGVYVPLVFFTDAYLTGMSTFIRESFCIHCYNRVVKILIFLSLFTLGCVLRIPSLCDRASSTREEQAVPQGL